MKIKYLRNPENLKHIIKGEEFGEFFNNWVELSESEILSYELKNAKNFKFAEISADRKEFQYSPITINGKTYKNTEIAQGKLFHLLSRMQDANYPIKWRLDDDITWTDLSKTQATNLSNRIIERETSAYQQESDFILLVQNAQTLEELNQIIINFQ